MSNSILIEHAHAHSCMYNNVMHFAIVINSYILYAHAVGSLLKQNKKGEQGNAMNEHSKMH